MRRIVVGLLGALLTCSTSLAQGLATPISGEWSGTYTCAQGETAVDLSIVAEDAQNWNAVFAFGPLKSNKRVPTGSYNMSVTREGDELVFTPGDWISQPADYVTVGMRGTISTDLMTITGQVEFETCTTFAIERTTPLPAPPAPKTK